MLSLKAARSSALSAGVTRIPASRAGLILLLQPSLSFVWDVILFGRPTDLTQALGAALAVTAIYLGSQKQ